MLEALRVSTTGACLSFDSTFDPSVSFRFVSFLALLLPAGMMLRVLKTLLEAGGLEMY